MALVSSLWMALTFYSSLFNLFKVSIYNHLPFHSAHKPSQSPHYSIWIDFKFLKRTRLRVKERTVVALIYERWWIINGILTENVLIQTYTHTYTYTSNKLSPNCQIALANSCFSFTKKKNACVNLGQTQLFLAGEERLIPIAWVCFLPSPHSSQLQDFKLWNKYLKNKSSKGHQLLTLPRD